MRHLVGQRSPRWIVVQAGLLAVLGAVSACGVKVGISEYVVHFAPGTPVDQARAVGEKCPKFGGAVLEPLGNKKLATNRAYPVRYDITSASSADKSALVACLQKYPIVRGVSDTNDDS